MFNGQDSLESKFGIHDCSNTKKFMMSEPLKRWDGRIGWKNKMIKREVVEKEYKYFNDEQRAIIVL